MAARRDRGPGRSTSEQTSARASWLWGTGLAALTLVAYSRVFGAETIWDDDAYLTENALLLAPGGFFKLWIPGNTPQYYPAVFTMFWAEVRLFGLDPTGFHVVNVFLHAAGALLLWRLGKYLRVPGAWMVAAVFAVHPVHVESVAWITERKNVLSGVFYLLAALAYLRFDQRRFGSDGGGGGSGWVYGGCLLAFTMALLSKSVTCTLPTALVVMLLWKREALSFRRLLPLAPLLVLGVCLGLHTAYVERTHVGAFGPDFDFSAAERILISSKALLFYPAKLLVPWPLMFVYPRWELDATALVSFWPTAVVLSVGVVALLLYLRGVRGPGLALAFFAGTLFPALGFFNVYPMRYSFVADHFQYLASIGVIALVVGVLALRLPESIAGWCGGCVLGFLLCLTWAQCGDYQDAETLWRSTLRKNPAAWIAHNNLADILEQRGQRDAALESLASALATTQSAEAGRQIRFSTAATLERAGRTNEALQLYRVLQVEAGGMQVAIGRLLQRQGAFAEAEAAFRRALDSDERKHAWQPYGLFLMAQGRPGEAATCFEELVDLAPEDPGLRMFLADAYAGAERYAEAISMAEDAHRIALDHPVPGSRMPELIQRRIADYRADAGGR